MFAQAVALCPTDHSGLCCVGANNGASRGGISAREVMFEPAAEGRGKVAILHSIAIVKGSAHKGRSSRATEGAQQGNLLICAGCPKLRRQLAVSTGYRITHAGGQADGIVR